MDFNEHLRELKAMLKVRYPAIDFDGGDLYVDNALTALALAITKRLNDPAPAREEVKHYADEDPEWRGFK